MLKVFQVNNGTFLNLQEDLNPSQRVQDLKNEVCRCTRSQQQDVVLMTMDGVLMDRNQIIASFGSGTDTKPILVFNRSILREPNLAQVILPEISDVCRNESIEEMARKPHSLLKLVQGFQSQAEQMDGVFDELLKEQDLQVRAWMAVQGNCTSILMTYQRQAGNLDTEYTAFHENLDRWRKEIEQFPDTVKLLDRVHIPKTLTGREEDVTLYSWINNQDPNSRLKDLAEDCTQALNKISSDINIEGLVDLSKEVIANVESTPQGVPGWKERSEQLLKYKHEVKKIIEHQLEYAKTVKTTLENALKSGDPTLVDDLKESQRKTLSIMGQNDKKARELLAQCLKSKIGLTENIHGRLQWVSEIQQQMSESSKNIVLAREQLKLLRKKMSVFVQICDAPRVLTEVLGEVLRRNQFDDAFKELTASFNKTASELRNEEKEKRRSFLAACGDHFLIRLYPGATEKPSLSKRVEDKDGSNAVRPLLTLEEAKEIVNGLPENLVQSFWTRSQISIPPDPSTNKMPFAMAYSSSEEGSSMNIAKLSPSPSEVDGNTSPLTATVSEQEGTIQELELQRKVLMKEKTHLMEDLAQQKGINDSFDRQVAELTKERSVLEDKLASSELTVRQLKEERDTFQRQFENVRSSESELQARHSQVEEQLEVHRSQCISETERTGVLKSRVSQLESIVAALEEAKEQLLDQSQFLKDRNLALLSENDHLLAQLRAFQDECKSLSEEKETLIVRVNEVEEAMSAKSELFDTLQMELVDLKKKNLQLEQLLEDASKEQEDMVREIADFKAKSTSLELEAARSKRELCEEREKAESLRQSLDEQMQSFGATYSTLLALRSEVGLLEQLLSIPSKSTDSTLPTDAPNSSIFSNILAVLTDGIKTARQHVLDLQSGLTETTRSNVSLHERQEHLEDEKRQLLTDKAELCEHNSTLTRQVEECEIEINRLKDQVSSLQTDNEQLCGRLEEKEREQKDSSQQVSKLIAKVQAVEVKGQSALQKKITDLEEQHSVLVEELKERENLLSATQRGILELTTERDDLQSRLTVMEESWSKTVQQEQDKVKSLELRLKEGEDKLFECEKEKDDALKKIMELERDAKELQRSMDKTLSESQRDTVVPKKPVVNAGNIMAESTEMVLSTSGHPIPTGLPGGQSAVTISVKNLNVGDVALFMALRRDSSPQKETYVAVTFDQRVYYLDVECVRNFANDLTPQSTALGKSGRRSFLGRVTYKQLCEVRKPDNRLGVTVGTKIFRLTAEEFPLPLPVKTSQ